MHKFHIPLDLSVFLENINTITNNSEGKLEYPGSIDIKTVFNLKNIYELLPTMELQSIALPFIEKTHQWIMDSSLESNKINIKAPYTFNTYNQYKEKYLRYTSSMLNFMLLFIKHKDEDRGKKLKILLYLVDNFRGNHYSLLMLHKVCGNFIEKVQILNKQLRISNAGYFYNLNKISEDCFGNKSYDKTDSNILEYTGIPKKNAVEIINDLEHIMNEYLFQKMLFDSARYIQLSAKKTLQKYTHDKCDDKLYSQS